MLMGSNIPEGRRMTKQVKIILASVLLIVLAVLLMHLLREEPVAREFEFNKTVSIRNTGTNLYYDTIVQVGLKSLGVDTAYVNIRPMPKEMAQTAHEPNAELKAALVAGPLGSRQYTIYVTNLRRYEAIRWLAHELIHLEQYQTGRLRFENGHAIYEGRNYGYPEALRYEERPWEAEAIHRSRVLQRSIENLLYLYPEDEGIREDLD
jgi:hypothetical protein